MDADADRSVLADASAEAAPAGSPGGTSLVPAGLRATAFPAIVTRSATMQAEAIRAVRTRIMAQHVREGRRAIAVCGVNPDTGCSYVAANLAASIAQIGVKVALVDADLRRPSIAGMFGLPTDQHGLADYLADPGMTLDDCMHDLVMPNLSVTTAGRVPSNPQELLASERFRVFTNQLLREFDLTVFDTTPAGQCTDAQRVATVAGYSLIVARKHKTYVNDIATLSKLLRADRSVIIGSVLNDY